MGCITDDPRISVASIAGRRHELWGLQCAGLPAPRILEVCEGTRRSALRPLLNFHTWQCEELASKPCLRACDFPRPVARGKLDAQAACAIHFATDGHFRIYLALSGRQPVSMNEESKIKPLTVAKPGLPNIPYATLGGSRKFLFWSYIPRIPSRVIREA